MESTALFVLSAFRSKKSAIDELTMASFLSIVTCGQQMSLLPTACIPHEIHIESEIFRTSSTLKMCWPSQSVVAWSAPLLPRQRSPFHETSRFQRTELMCRDRCSLLAEANAKTALLSSVSHLIEASRHTFRSGWKPTRSGFASHVRKHSFFCFPSSYTHLTLLIYQLSSNHMEVRAFPWWR